MNELTMKIIAALLFAIAFTLIGWTAPILYATHAPSENFIEVHSFVAQDATVDSERHYVCFDRTIKQETAGTIYTELYLVNGETDERVEIGNRNTIDSYFQTGHEKVIAPMELPEAVVPGTYRYLLVVQLELADSRVTRSFAFESTTFNISEVGTQNLMDVDYDCD